MGMSFLVLRRMYIEASRLNIFWFSSDVAKRAFLRRTGITFLMLWAARRVHKDNGFRFRRPDFQSLTPAEQKRVD